MLTRHINWRCGTKISSASIHLIQKSSRQNRIIHATGTLVKTRGGKAAYYTVSLPKLQCGRTYFYQLKNGNIHSHWHSFSLPTKNKKISFLFFGDLQFEPGKKVFYNFSILLKRFPTSDFWAFCGDMIERPSDKYWRCWFSTLGHVADRMPIVAAPGNHEFLKGFSQKLDERWLHNFVYPHNSPEGNIGCSYFIDYPQMRLIIIDTQTASKIFSLLYFRKWLEKVLSQAGNKWKIVLMHHPIYSSKRGRNNFAIRYAFRPLFEHYGVHLILQGHDHSYARLSTRTHNGGKHTPIYIISVCSPKHYKVIKNSSFERLIANRNFWQQIEINGDTLHFSAHELNSGTLCDSIVILKCGLLRQIKTSSKISAISHKTKKHTL